MLWEAQFGDFANSAQVIIDQFIVSRPGQVGPDLAADAAAPPRLRGLGSGTLPARLERFLQLAAEGNIRVANLTTPAQYFHLLRRQARITKQRPLVILTPKSLLRLPQATNRIEHLAESQFFPVLGEPRVPIEKVTRLVLCTGKIYYDLVGHPDRAGQRGRGRSAASSCCTPSRRRRSWSSSTPTRTSRRSCGSRRSRATWAPARTCPRACMQMLPEHLHFGYIGRPERAVARRGLSGRPHRRAEPHPADRAGPVGAGVDVSDQDAGRALNTRPEGGVQSRELARGSFAQL